MKLRILCAALLFVCAAAGQQPSGRIAFEVASIKSGKPPVMGKMFIGMNADAGMLRYTNVSLKDCIRVAYRVQFYQIQGPDWLGSERFTILAKLPEGSSKDQIPEMLQSLLADRFKLTVHRDTKEHPIYALVVAKGGPKLKAAEVPSGRETKAGPNAGEGGLPRGGMMMRMGLAGMHLSAPSMTLQSLAEMISRFTERPVLDMTGIQGEYDFDLAFAPETMHGMLGGMRDMPRPGAAMHAPEGAPSEPSEPAASIYDAVQQYGLKLEPRKAPVEILVVDHIEKTPTEN